MTARSSSTPRQKSPQRRSATPATYAFVIFVVLAMCRLLIFRPELHVNASTRQQVTVRNVIDGDTIDLTDGRRVRLLGIDAPEAGFFEKKAEPWSQESTQWLRDRIEGQAVTLRIDEHEKDKYGRTLAWIYGSDNILINQQILAEGYAKLLPDFGLPLELEPALREAESEARVQRLGLWGLTQK